MDQGQAVDQESRVVAVLARALRLVLVDDLKAIFVDACFVEKGDILDAAVVALEDLDVILLYARGLIDDAFGGPGDLLLEEARPFVVRELDVVERFELLAQVGDQVFFVLDGQIFIALRLKAFDEVPLQV